MDTSINTKSRSTLLKCFKLLFQTAGNIESTAASSNQMEALVQRYYYHQELDKAHEQMKVMFTKYHLMD